METVKEYRKRESGLWDAFVGFMESIYWKNCIEEFTWEQIAFHYEQFKECVTF